MKKIFFFFIMTYLALDFNERAGADLFKWTDPKGVIHISDHSPQNKEVKGPVESLSINKEGPGPKSPPHTETQSRFDKPAQTANTDKELKQPKTPRVEIYTTSWCPYCRQARGFFQSRGISFTEYDIERDKNAALRLKEMNPRKGVPLAIINGQRVLGFSEASYKKALKETP